METSRGAAFEGFATSGCSKGCQRRGETVDLERAYRVIADDFVSLEDGTGIVHIAPAYGDLEIGRKYGLPTLFSVDLAGKMLREFNPGGFGEIFFKDADPIIMNDLARRGLLFRGGKVRHSYPFCWRCDTPLLYYAKPSWYIRTTARKEPSCSRTTSRSTGSRSTSRKDGSATGWRTTSTGLLAGSGTGAPRFPSGSATPAATWK